VGRWGFCCGNTDSCSELGRGWSWWSTPLTKPTIIMFLQLLEIRKRYGYTAYRVLVPLKSVLHCSVPGQSYVYKLTLRCTLWGRGWPLPHIHVQIYYIVGPLCIIRNFTLNTYKVKMLKLAVLVCLVALCAAQTPTRPNIPETFFSPVSPLCMAVPPRP